MKTPASFFRLLRPAGPSRRSLPAKAAALCLAASAAFCAAAAPDRFERTKAHIDALLSPRLKPDPLPAKPANPFLFSGTSALFNVGGGGSPAPVGPGKAPVTTTPEATPNAAMSDDQILAYCVTRIRIGGQVLLGERTHLLINSTTYKEGDLIPVRANAETVYYVKIVRIAPGEVVFGYNATFVTLPLKS